MRTVTVYPQQKVEPVIELAPAQPVALTVVPPLQEMSAADSRVAAAQDNVAAAYADQLVSANKEAA